VSLKICYDSTRKRRNRRQGRLSSRTWVWTGSGMNRSWWVQTVTVTVSCLLTLCGGAEKIIPDIYGDGWWAIKKINNMCWMKTALLCAMSSAMSN